MRIPLAAVDRLVRTGANQGEPAGVQEVVQGLAALDELHAGQAELLEEVRGLRDEIAGLLKRQQAVEERGPSGIPYELEIEGFWDDRPHGNLQVIVQLDASDRTVAEAPQDQR